MKRLFLMFGLMFLAGCAKTIYPDYSSSNYWPASMSQQSPIQSLKAKGDELDELRAAIVTEAQQLSVDMNDFYKIILPDFLSSLDNNQLAVYGDYRKVAFKEADDPVENEKMARKYIDIFAQIFNLEKQKHLLKIMSQENALIDRKEALTKKLSEYQIKYRAFQKYADALIQTTQREQDAINQRALLRQPQSPVVIYQQQPMYQPPQNYPIYPHQQNDNYWQEQRAQQEYWDSLRDLPQRDIDRIMRGRP